MYFGRMLGNKIFKQEQPLIAHVQNCLVCAEGRHNFLWTSEKEKRKSRPVSGFKPTNVSPQMTLILSARVYVACKCMRVWLKLVFKFQDSSGQRETDCVRVRVQLTIHGETSFYSFLFAKRPFTLWRQRIASHHTSFFLVLKCLCMVACRVTSRLGWGRLLLLNLVRPGGFSHRV